MAVGGGWTPVKVSKKSITSPRNYFGNSLEKKDCRQKGNLLITVNNPSPRLYVTEIRNL